MIAYWIAPLFTLLCAAAAIAYWVRRFDREHCERMARIEMSTADYQNEFEAKKKAWDEQQCQAKSSYVALVAQSITNVDSSVVVGGRKAVTATDVSTGEAGDLIAMIGGVPFSGLGVAEVIERDAADRCRIKVRLPWLPAWTPWVRIMSRSTHQGKNSGLLFQPRVGDSVLVAFEQGLPLIVLGGMSEVGVGVQLTIVGTLASSMTAWEDDSRKCVTINMTGPALG